MNLAETIKALLEYLGGVTDVPPPSFPNRMAWLWRGLWWGLLLCAIATFCGQTSRFLYIDF